jgi:hypothetical protein
MLTLTLAVLAAAPAAAAESAVDLSKSKVFSGCKATPIQGGGMFACEGFMASVSDVEGTSVQVAAEAHLAGMRASINGEVTVEEVTFKAGDKSWPGQRFSVTRPPETKAVFEGTMLAFKAPNGAARLITCGAPPGGPADSRCPPVLAALAENGPPPQLRPDPNASAKFIDQDIPPPEGCKLTESAPNRFQLTCGTTAFLSYLGLNSADELPRVSGLIREQLLNGVPGAKEGKAKDCKLGGVKTRCTVIETADAVFYVAGAVVKGKPVALQCGQEKSRKGIHPVCAKVFAWK